jgi:hypothetical protein
MLPRQSRSAKAKETARKPARDGRAREIVRKPARDVRAGEIARKPARVARASGAKFAATSGNGKTPGRTARVRLASGRRGKN